MLHAQLQDYYKIILLGILKLFLGCIKDLGKSQVSNAGS